LRPEAKRRLRSVLKHRALFVLPAAAALAIFGLDAYLAPQSAPTQDWIHKLGIVVLFGAFGFLVRLFEPRS